MSEWKAITGSEIIDSCIEDNTIRPLESVVEDAYKQNWLLASEGELISVHVLNALEDLKAFYHFSLKESFEGKEKKFSKENHALRLEKIIDNWDMILKIIDEELPSLKEFDNILNTIEAPKTAGEIGIDESIIPLTFKASKDIRDKYVLPRLAWDLGVIDEINF